MPEAQWAAADVGRQCGSSSCFDSSGCQRRAFGRKIRSRRRRSEVRGSGRGEARSFYDGGALAGPPGSRSDGIDGRKDDAVQRGEREGIAPPRRDASSPLAADKGSLALKPPLYNHVSVLPSRRDHLETPELVKHRLVAILEAVDRLGPPDRPRFVEYGTVLPCARRRKVDKIPGCASASFSSSGGTGKGRVNALAYLSESGSRSFSLTSFSRSDLCLSAQSTAECRLTTSSPILADEGGSSAGGEASLTPK